MSEIALTPILRGQSKKIFSGKKSDSWKVSPVVSKRSTAEKGFYHEVSPHKQLQFTKSVLQERKQASQLTDLDSKRRE